MNKTVIVKYGEIALKGKNRSFFENVLVRNMRRALEGMEYKLFKTHGRIFIDDVDDIEEAVDRLSKVFGLVELSIGYRTELDLDEMNSVALMIMEDELKLGHKTFKAETRRSNKGFKLNSPEISRRVGGYVNTTLEGISVDVHNPESVLNIEVREKAYLYAKRIPAVGGMPYGTTGKSILLLSGGIDSPVAGYLMARRGVELACVHFHSFPFTSDRAKEKVIDLAKLLAEKTDTFKLYNVNILEIQSEINKNCNTRYSTLLQRRFMTRIGEAVAEIEKAKSLITGESIGQVASQTMESLNVTNSTVDIPIFRPLIAMDKKDIVKISQEIGTFETSILPFEDCCTVFLPEKVATRPNLEDVQREESKLDVEQLVKRAIENIEVMTIER